MRRLLVIFLGVLLLLARAARAEEFTSESFWGDSYRLRVEAGLLHVTGPDGAAHQPVAVQEGFIEAARALQAEGGYVASPDGVAQALLPLLDDSLTGGLPVRDSAVNRTEILLLLENPGGGLTVRVAQWNGSGYDCLDNPTLPEGYGLDTIHFGDGELYLQSHDDASHPTLYFGRRAEGDWRLDSLQNGRVSLHWCGLGDPEVFSGVTRNDHVRYGDLPRWTLADADLSSLPADFDDLCALMDSSAWAVVNNPDPADRLHLRASPDRASTSLGKFYNRTPVRILQEEGEWVQVRIGQHLTGWMMARYLARGEAMDGVASAFPDLYFAEGYAALSPTPWPSGSPDWLTRNREYIIGVTEDEGQYILMNSDGQVGLLPTGYFTPGNG